MAGLVARLVLFVAVVGLASACRHKVEVQAPKEPIVINMNIKIEHEVRVKVDKDLEHLFEENDALF